MMLDTVRSQQVEAGKYEYPHQIYKVPVKTHFFNHFIVATALVSAVHSVDQGYNIKTDTCGHVKTVETSDRKEVVEEVVRRSESINRICRRQHMASVLTKEVMDRRNGCSRVYERAPPTAFTVQV